TCDADPPDWAIRFRDGTADLNEFVYGTGASFWVRNLPLIPFIPIFAAAIRRERQTGFLFPKFGYSTRKGAYAETPFFWAIDDSQDLLFSPIMYTNLGEGFNFEYRYILPENQRGRAAGFFMQESFKHGSTRFIGTTRQDWVLGPRTWLKVDVSGVSDHQVLSDYGDTLYQRSAQRVESNIFLTRNWDSWNLYGNLFFYQDLTTPQPVALRRLPEFHAVGAPQPLHDLPGVLWQFEGSAINFVRDLGSSGGRIDLHPQVLRPIPVGVITVSPFVGARLTGYNRTVTGLRTEPGVSGFVEETNDDPRLRRLLEAGGDVETKLTRVFNTGGFWNIDAMLHTIEPRVNYT
ncbi:MAG TPA: LPS assembly protein LptD, partial [Vicinamibacterales bacterium]|nr:LPS assembly protein LptD [Vicinamibacterales bacterium]